MTAFKRFTALAWAGVLAITLTLPAFAAGTYSDLPQTHWAYRSMDTAAWDLILIFIEDLIKIKIAEFGEIFPQRSKCS